MSLRPIWRALRSRADGTLYQRSLHSSSVLTRCSGGRFDAPLLTCFKRRNLVFKSSFSTSTYLRSPQKSQNDQSHDLDDWDRELGPMLPPMRAGWMPSGYFEKASDCDRISTQMTENDAIIQICYQNFDTYEMPQVVNVAADTIECVSGLEEGLDRLGKTKMISPQLLSLHERMEAHRDALLKLRKATLGEIPRFGNPQGLRTAFTMGPRICPAAKGGYYAAVATMIGVPAAVISLIVLIVTGAFKKTTRDG